MLRRVEVQRRPAAGEGEPRHGVLHGRGEQVTAVEDALDVVVAEQRPEPAVVGRTVRDRAGRAQFLVERVGAGEGLRSAGVEVMGFRVLLGRGHHGLPGSAETSLTVDICRFVRQQDDVCVRR